MLYIYLFLKSIQPANQVLQAMSRLTVTKPSLKQHGLLGPAPHTMSFSLSSVDQKLKIYLKKNQTKQTTPKQT